MVPTIESDTTLLMQQFTRFISSHRKAFRCNVSYHYIKELAASCVRNQPAHLPSQCITEMEVRSLKARFDQLDVVISTLDHNNGMLFIS